MLHPQGAALRAVFDWRQEGKQTWEIRAETDAGQMTLTDGGARLFIDGVEQTPPGGDPSNDLGHEYPRLYARMADLVEAGESDVDLSPFVLVADAFMIGERRQVAAFDW